MERSEPTLVPQWLRSTASVTGAGNSAHHPVSSSHSDVSLAPHARSRAHKSIGELDSPRSAFLDRSSSSNSRRGSSNGSAKHAYSSFNRSHREKDRDRFGDPWDHDSSDPLGNIFSRDRVDKDTLRRSQSMVSRKQGEPLPRRGSVDFKNTSNSNHTNGNGVISGGTGSSIIQKAVFEKDFPSLGTDERQGVSDIGRVPSPSFPTAVQSLPVVNSALVGGEGWTSALAEVPSMMGGNSSGSSVQQPVPTAMTGLNMAEALAQAPSRARSAPQVSVKTQRLEELAIKQSRQLIPVTPSMPKASVSSEKSKPKTGLRTGDVSTVTKTGQQQPSLFQNANHQYMRGGSVKPDAPKTSHGKFLVLKPVWENGVTPSKDVTSPKNSAQLPAAPPIVAVPSRSPNGQKVPSLERKVSALDLKSGHTLEKRPLLSQVQSRNDFFNLIKKKTSGTNPSTALPDSAPKSLAGDKSSDLTRETENMNGNGENCKQTAEDEFHSNGALYLDEEEAKFLRSLGWDENAGEDEGLTEEEINAFYEECLKKKPVLKLCRGMQPKLSMLCESDAAGASSQLSSSDSGSDA